MLGCIWTTRAHAAGSDPIAQDNKFESSDAHAFTRNPHQPDFSALDVSTTHPPPIQHQLCFLQTDKAQRFCPSALRRRLPNKLLHKPIRRYSWKVSLVGPNCCHTPTSARLHALAQRKTRRFSFGSLVGKDSNIAEAHFFAVMM